MFKDVFKLKKDSWYMWLMKYIWGLDYYNFSHVCPVFWITIINIVIFPFVAVVKLVLLPLRKLIKAIDNSLDKKLDQRYALKSKFREEFIDKIKRDPIILKDYITKLVQVGNDELKKIPKIYKGLYDDIYYYSDTEFRLKFDQLRDQIRLERNKLVKQKQQLEREAMIKRKNKIATIVKFTKPIGQGILIILSLLLIYLIGEGIYLLYKMAGKLSHKDLVNGLIAVGFILTVFVLAYGTTKLVSYVANKIPVKEYDNTPFTESHVSIWSQIGKPIIWLFKGLVTLISLIGQMIKNNCPGIEWE
jgi:hypothetical protein